MARREKANVRYFKNGCCICGDSVLELRNVDKTGLVIADPPYGGVLKEKWDNKDEDILVTFLFSLMSAIEAIMLPGGALYMFGGTGIPGNRTFYRFMATVEKQFSMRWQIANHITWAKKRAYGVQNNYLYTREEIAYLVYGNAKKPLLFQVPHLAQKRGYDGYNEEYPAKSEFLRRTNVWSDVTEIFRGKVFSAQKPVDLLKIPIQVHTKPGDLVVDPCAGSGTTAIAASELGRRFACVERDPKTFELMVDRLVKAGV